MTRVLIAVPCAAYCEAETFKSIYGLLIPDNTETSFDIVQGYTVEMARNKIVEISLKNVFDYTFFVDSDIILPDTILGRLLAICEKGADMATGWYIKKNDSGTTVISSPKYTDNEFRLIKEDELPQDIIIPIYACGFGCMLVKNEVFKKLLAADGICFEWIQGKESAVGEDLIFCDKAIKKADAKIMADTSLRCTHIGRKFY